MIQSCKLEAMLVAGSCHRYSHCYRNSSSRCPPCCGNYRVADSHRRAQLDLNKTTCVCVCVCMAVSQFLLFVLTSRQANQVLSILTSHPVLLI